VAKIGAPKGAGVRVEHSLLWRIKLRLQFTGWFQYVPNAAAAFAFLVLAALGWLIGVWPVVGAHEFLVAIGPRAYDRTAIVDVGRSLQGVVLEATRMGVATCWIGPGADHTSVVHHLGDRFDPEADHIVCVCALGYRSRYVPAFIRVMQRAQHRRLPLTSLFFAGPDFCGPLAVTAPPPDMDAHDNWVTMLATATRSAVGHLLHR